MVQKLSHLGFLNYKKYGIIFMTDKGVEVGRFLLHRHEIIQNFLFSLGVEEDLLLETELIEHNISITTLKKIDLYNQFLIEHPSVRVEFLNFIEFYEESKTD
jgi:Mn-dependent DtxR family transcriptional regulator